MMVNHVWRAVRCCCTPRKILGFMLIEERLTSIDVNGTRCEIMEFGQQPCRTSADIEVRELFTARRSYRRELAIHSNDLPIEVWRLQEGFIEHLSDDTCHDNR